MCGIAGYIDSSGSTPAERLEAVSRRMARTLAHRGPDDEGTWVDAAAGVALAHRRLAILDLSSDGHQPMCSADGRYVFTYNGETYNHLELRAELERRGQRFRGHSDTEVLLACILEWGFVPAIRRCNGMFAAALWDKEKRTLHLFRDRFGEKPLYCGWNGRLFLFASELKAIRAHPEFDCELDRSALALFVRHGYVPGPHCVYRGLIKLPPGTIASVDTRRPGHIEQTAYWSAREAVLRCKQEPFLGSPADAVCELDRLLLDSVRLRMAADVPVGAFLSGGTDSSTIVAMMQMEAHQAARTFSIGFQSDGHDEAAHARRVAAHLGTSHTELYVTGEEALSVIPKMPQLYDEPFADSSQIPTYLVAALARRSVTVALSGDGGDELFGGYTRYAVAEQAWSLVSWLPYGVRAVLARIVAATPVAASTFALALLRTRHVKTRRSGAEVLRTVSDLLTSPDAVSLYRKLTEGGPDTMRLIADPCEPPLTLRDDDVPRTIHRFLERMMFWDTVTYLPDDILTKVDRASMSVGLETRVPLLDHRVFEFAWTLPAQVRLRDGVRKWPMREVLYRYVPRELVDRPKRGFSAPLAAWLRGPLHSWARDLLSEEAIERQGILNPGPVKRMLAEHESATRDWHSRLWIALVLQGWLAETGSGPADVSGGA